MKSLAIGLLFVSAAAFAGAPPAAVPAGEGRIAVHPAEIQWGEGPPTLGPGAKQVLLEGDPKAPAYFAMRVKLPANFAIAPHVHAAAERVTVISGGIWLGFGDVADPAKATLMEPGSYYSNPPGVAHYLFTKEETVIQIAGIGPWSIEYRDPATDPRNAKKQ